MEINVHCVTEFSSLWWLRIGLRRSTLDGVLGVLRDMNNISTGTRSRQERDLDIHDISIWTIFPFHFTEENTMQKCKYMLNVMLCKRMVTGGFEVFAVFIYYYRETLY